MDEADATTPQVQESQLRQWTPPRVFQRGVSYLESGAIERVVRRGQRIQAGVQGSAVDPYQVRLVLDEDGLVDASCTCPYDHGGLCKHEVAVGLRLAREPDRVETRPSTAQRLSDVPREDLVELVEHLVERAPELADTVDAWLAANHRTGNGPGDSGNPGENTVDADRYRERVRELVHSLDGMRSSEAYWHVSDVVDDVIGVGREAEPFLDAGESRAALEILEAVTSAYHAEWLVLDGSDGSPPNVFYELCPLWTQALLDIRLDEDPPGDALADVADELEAWIEDLLDYGIASALDAALFAAREGWTAVRNPDEATTLDDGVPPEDPAEDELSSLEASRRRARAEATRRAREQVVDAALDVLERRERYEDALEIADARDRPDRVASLLASTGSPGTAVEHALEHVDEPAHLLDVARTLEREGNLDRALDLGARGLEVDGPAGDRAELAAWLERLARDQGDLDLTREAARRGFLVEPTIRRFEALEELAGDGWPKLREDLLDALGPAADVDPFAKVDVLLHAGRVEAAIEVVRGEDHHALVDPVAEAAVDVDPDWVVEASLAQAEPIVEKGRSKQYKHAVDWLDKARRAWLERGDEQTWEAYLANLREEHKLKRKLMGLLDERFGAHT